MKSTRLFAYLQLMRPANIVTAMADILAGVAVAISPFAFGFQVDKFIGGNTDTGVAVGSAIEGVKIKGLPAFLWPVVSDILNCFIAVSYIDFYTLFLLLTTVGLYGGGVVFNDVFDAKLDAVERPERPIPSGRASLRGATILGGVLLILGILFAFQVSLISGIVAVFIAFFALLYDKIGKYKAWGPLNMGLCRGLNLFLGISVWAAGITIYSLLSGIEYTRIIFHPSFLLFLPLIPILYIAAITAVSRGEVHGGSKRSFYLPFALYGTVVLAILGILFLTATPLWQSLPFLLFFTYLIFPPLIRAYRDPQPRHIGLAVKAGVIALIAMDAAIAAAFAGWVYGGLVLALLPISRLLARVFAVT